MKKAHGHISEGLQEICLTNSPIRVGPYDIAGFRAFMVLELAEGHMAP